MSCENSGTKIAALKVTFVSVSYRKYARFQFRMSEQKPNIPPTIYKKVLWMQLAELRKERHLTQGRLADLCGVKQVTISHIENGRSTPSLMLSHRLSKLFDFEKLEDFRKDLEARIDWQEYEHLITGVMSLDEGREYLRNRPSLLTMRKKIKQGNKKPILNFAGQTVETSDTTSSVDELSTKLKKYTALTDIQGNSFLSNGVYVSDPTPQYLEIPSILKGVKGAYALYVHDNSMDPRYSKGDTVLVNPEILATPGDDVVVQVVQGNKTVAVIRRLEHLYVNFDALAPLSEMITPNDSDGRGQNKKVNEFLQSDAVKYAVHRRFLLTDMSMAGFFNKEYQKPLSEKDWSLLEEKFLVISQTFSGKSRVSGQGGTGLFFSTPTGLETENTEITKAAVHPIVGCYRLEKSINERAQAYKSEIGKLNDK